MLGIYEASISKISFETGINKDIIQKAFKRFETDRKVNYIGNYVCLLNYMKHQKYNTNMMKSAIDCFNELPFDLRNGQTIDREDTKEGFRTLSNRLGTVSKIEVEVEEEIEDENETEEGGFERFWNEYDKKVGDKTKLLSKWKKLPQEDKDKIFEHIPLYKADQPDKKFRKNPDTYLNNKSWNDELVNAAPVHRGSIRL